MRAQDLRANGPRSRRLRSYVWPTGSLALPVWLDAIVATDGPPITKPCDAFLIVTIHLYYSGGSRLAGKTIARALYV
jgi:hypothetical protein